MSYTTREPNKLSSHSVRIREDNELGNANNREPRQGLHTKPPKGHATPGRSNSSGNTYSHSHSEHSHLPGHHANLATRHAPSSRDHAHLETGYGISDRHHVSSIDHAASARSHAHFTTDHAPSGRNHAHHESIHNNSPRSHAHVDGDHAHLEKDHAPLHNDHVHYHMDHTLSHRNKILSPVYPDNVTNPRKKKTTFPTRPENGVTLNYKNPPSKQTVDIRPSKQSKVRNEGTTKNYLQTNIPNVPTSEDKKFKRFLKKLPQYDNLNSCEDVGHDPTLWADRYSDSHSSVDPDDVFTHTGGKMVESREQRRPSHSQRLRRRSSLAASSMTRTRRGSVKILEAWKKEHMNTNIVEAAELISKRRRSVLHSSETNTTEVEVQGPQRPPPIQVFRRVARLVRLLCSVCLAIRSYAIGKGLLDDYLVAISHRRNKGDDEEGDMEELTFNLKDFKIKKELDVPASTVALLEKRPEDRTAEDVATINRLMRGLPSFRKYTREMQLLFCKIVRYMKCQENRVVLRKGHIGYNLYFIYTGACSVVLDKDDTNVFVKKEVIVLRKGACFGEIALVQNTRRNATVVCTEDTEFLVVDKELFLDNGLNLQMEQEFHFRYEVFRRLPMFADWKDEEVRELSNVSRNEEFRYNKVVVKDSRKNDWLWFVIKGSCDILRLVDLEKCPSFQRVVLGKGPSARRSLEHLAAATRGALLRPPPGHHRQGGNMSTAPHKGSTWSVLSDDDSDWSPVNSSRGGYSHRDAAQPAAELKREITEDGSPRVLEDIAELDDVIQNLTVDNVEEVLKVIGTGTEDKENVEQAQEEEQEEDEGSEIPKDAGYGLFFKLDTLRDGQCFGADTIREDCPEPTRNLLLVSRGCEVIHVPKTRFREIAERESLFQLEKSCKVYPSDDLLCQRFVSRCRWDAYKDEVVEDVLAHRTRGRFEDNLRASTALEEVPSSKPALEEADTDWLRETSMAYRRSPVSPFLGTQLRHTARPHTSYGLRTKHPEKREMKKSWEMDLDLMTSLGRSRDRPRTCPPRVDRRQHLQGPRTHSDYGAKTPRSARGGGTSTLTAKGYKVDGTNVYVKGSQGTLQVISAIRSRSHEDRLHKLKSGK